MADAAPQIQRNFDEMRLFACHGATLFVALGFSIVLPSSAQVTLLAVGSLTDSHAGPNADLSGLTYKLENGAPRICSAVWDPDCLRLR